MKKYDMKWSTPKFAFLAGVMIVAGSAAYADDSEAFKGLIPGIPLEEAELATVHGKGANFTFTLQDGSLISNNGTLGTFNQTSNQVGTTTGNNGITIPTQFVGDNNVVNVTVAIEVNIGTVSVSDNNGSAVTVNQTVDLSSPVDVGVGR